MEARIKSDWLVKGVNSIIGQHIKTGRLGLGPTAELCEYYCWVKAQPTLKETIK